MGILQKLFGSNALIHPDFPRKFQNWYFNRDYNWLDDGSITLKVRFAFDNPGLLDNCPFFAKVGNNLDPDVSGQYVGFAYGSGADEEKLRDWAKKFPFSELIIGLDEEGMHTPESKFIPITGKQ